MACFSCWLGALLGFGAALAGDVNGVFFFDESVPTPQAVLEVQACDADERTPVHRRPFAGGFVFAVKCASNNENFVETLVFSRGADGAGASLIELPLPDHRGGGTQDTISNIRWYADTNEVGEIFVDREVEGRTDPKICRTEGRWKLEGLPPRATLVWWRETADCEGSGGWITILGDN